MLNYKLIYEQNLCEQNIIRTVQYWHGHAEWLVGFYEIVLTISHVAAICMIFV